MPSQGIPETVVTKLERGPEGWEKVLESTRPFQTLWKCPEFQLWLKAMEGELRYLDNLKWNAHGNPSAVETRVLQRMGLEAPKSREDEFEIFKAVRAVVNYVTNHMDQIRKASETFERLQREELRRDNNG